MSSRGEVYTSFEREHERRGSARRSKTEIIRVGEGTSAGGRFYGKKGALDKRAALIKEAVKNALLKKSGKSLSDWQERREQAWRREHHAGGRMEG